LKISKIGGWVSSSNIENSWIGNINAMNRNRKEKYKHIKQVLESEINNKIDNNKEIMNNKKFYWKTNIADLVKLFDLLYDNNFIGYAKNKDKILSNIFDCKGIDNIKLIRQQLKNGGLNITDKMNDFLNKKIIK
jgi:hypothetical protein